MPSRQKVEAEPRLTKHKRIFYIGLTALILLPSVISAKSLVQKSILDASVKNFARKN